MEPQQQGFDYTYDKRLYDRLRDGHARPVRDHFRADMDFQRRSARFLENHDEPRAAATFQPGAYEASAVLTFLCPGLRFIHQGQIEGRTRRIPVHLARGPAEPTNTGLVKFYDRLLECLRRPEPKKGQWQLLDCTPAWDSNWTWDSFICFAWRGPGKASLVVVVNFASHQSQCLLRLPFLEIKGRTLRLQDLMSPAVYERSGDEILTHGLYLDLPAEEALHVFNLVR